MNVSQKGLSLIKNFEGFRADAYLDPVGIPTIGYGTIHYPDRRAVRMGEVVSQEQAEAFLRDECQEICREVDKLVKVELNQNQIDALISFCYNLGTGSLAESTLLRVLNENKFDQAAKEFGRWVNAVVDGVKKPLEGLVRRRAEEADLFQSKSEAAATEPPAKGANATVTLVEGYREGAKTVMVAWSREQVVEILETDILAREDASVLLKQYPNAQGFRIADTGKTVPAGQRTTLGRRPSPSRPAGEVPPLNGRILVRGTEGEEVRLLQSRLFDLRFYQGASSGIFDSATDVAVRAFQAEFFGPPEADGKVGPITWGKLWGEHEAPAAAAPTVGSAEVTRGLNYLKLTKTTSKDQFGCIMLNFEYYKDGVVKENLKVCSGGPSHQAFRTGPQSVSGSFEPLPEGHYSVADLVWAAGRDVYGPIVHNSGLGPVTVPLEYLGPSSTSRSALEIHIDWNRSEGAPGTAGCIGIYSISDYKKFVTWLRDTDPRDLFVDWGLGTCPEPSRTVKTAVR